MSYLYTNEQVQEMWKRPYEEQIDVARAKCMEVVVKTKGNLYVNFSGGKDSCVMLYLIAEAWSLTIGRTNPRMVLNVFFADTTLEHKEVLEHIPRFLDYIEQTFNVRINFIKARGDGNFFSVVSKVGLPFVSKKMAKSIKIVRQDLNRLGLKFSNIEGLLPKRISPAHSDEMVECAKKLRSMKFSVSAVAALVGVSGEYRYSRQFLISKQYRPLIDAEFDLSEECCYHLKKSPIKIAKKYFGARMMPVIGELAQDSRDRLLAYRMTGCNSFDSSNPISKPLGPMTEQALLKFIDRMGIPYAKCYGELVVSGGLSVY